MNSAPAKSWRDVLPVHPAAELFPMMSREELLALGADIKKTGLKSPIVMWAAGDNENQFQLLDGRNRLDAMELVGMQTIQQDKDGKWQIKNSIDGKSHLPGNHGRPVAYLCEFEKSIAVSFGGGKSKEVRKPETDPYDYVLSANIHRRHLTPEQRRELIGKLLKATPGKSNRQIATQVKADDKTVAKVRTELEATADIPQLKKTIGKDGKARPSHQSTPTPTAPSSPPSSPPPSSSQINPLIAVWDKARPMQRHDFIKTRKMEILRAQHEVGASMQRSAVEEIADRAEVRSKAMSDGLDIPDYLRRPVP